MDDAEAFIAEQIIKTMHQPNEIKLNLQAWLSFTRGDKILKAQRFS
jgi:hypothetical protein